VSRAAKESGGLEEQEISPLLSDARSILEATVELAQAHHRRGSLLSAAVWSQIAAQFATYRHTGSYVSAELEALLLDIARALPERGPRLPNALSRDLRHADPQRRVLHVVTRAHPFGGHTRVIERWALNDASSTHGLVATAQTEPLPSWLRHAIVQRRGFYEPLAACGSLLRRARRLRAIASDWADLVVLHVHPYDVVPMLAFGVEGGPPVVLFNHSDATFWLGARIADQVADMRESGLQNSLERRGVRSSRVLPIPLRLEERGRNRELARRRLEIPQDSIVLLTVGEDFKFVPLEKNSFFATVDRLLSRHPEAVLLGAGLRDPARYRSSIHNDRIARVRFLRPRDGIADLQSAADIYLDPFPATSLTAALEAASIGIPVVSRKNLVNPLFSSGDDASFKAAGHHVETVKEYEARAEALIADASLRAAAGGELELCVRSHHMPPGWNAYLERLIDSLPRRHTLLPHTRITGRADSADALLARFEAAGAPQFGLHRCIADSSRYFDHAERLSLLGHALARRGAPFRLPVKAYAPESWLVFGKRALTRISRTRPLTHRPSA
jgi:hypothetical protein